jgi:hypothetical protein
MKGRLIHSIAQRGLEKLVLLGGTVAIFSASLGGCVSTSKLKYKDIKGPAPVESTTTPGQNNLYPNYSNSPITPDGIFGVCNAYVEGPDQASVIPSGIEVASTSPNPEEILGVASVKDSGKENPAPLMDVIFTYQTTDLKKNWRAAFSYNFEKDNIVSGNNVYVRGEGISWYLDVNNNGKDRYDIAMSDLFNQTTDQAIQLTREGKERIIITGNEEFVKQVRKALDLIRGYDPKSYNEIISYIDEVRNREGQTAIAVLTKVCFVTSKTAFASLEWLACSLIHEKDHSLNFWNNKVYEGKEGELNAIKKQAEFLEKINAPLSLINYLKAADGMHFDENGNGVPDGEDQLIRSQKAAKTQN